MKPFELIATTTFGVEAVVKRELQNLGFDIVKSENGKITFLSDFSGIARANLWLRSADRVLLKMAEFKVLTFDELFERTKALDWADIIPVDGQFTVNGKSVKSTLFSISDCQAIVKKAIVEQMKQRYHVAWFSESQGEYTVQVSVLNDIATLTIDTSGEALHKRGYRQKTVEAPIKETLAAALIQLSYWNKERVLFDPFCGSGTIPIEAALMGRNIAPGINRDFASMHWPWIEKHIWDDEIQQAIQNSNPAQPITIYASDIDPESIEAAKQNAKSAGVSDCITFSVSDFKDVKYLPEFSVLITNPPYGERLKETETMSIIYNNMKKVWKPLDTWSLYLLTAYTNFPNVLSRKPDRERKLYNGNIEVHYFQYYGPRPPRELSNQ